MKKYVRDVSALLLLLLMITGVLLGTDRTVLAASATIKLEQVTEEVQKGDKFSVTVAVTSTSTIGELLATVKYDTNALRFETETSIYEEQDGRISIEDSGSEEGTTSKKYVLEFTALKKGTSNISIYGTPEVYDTNGTILSISKNKLSIKVNEQREKSNNANLASIVIKEGALEQTFKSSVTEYDMNVAQGVSKLSITAEPESEYATVEISGAEKLLVGSNTVTIKVTSETKKTKEYKITVVRGMDSVQSSSNEATVQQPEASPGEQLLENGRPDDGKEESLENNPQDIEQVQEEETDEVAGESIEEDGSVLTISNSYELLSVENLLEVPSGYLSVQFSINGTKVDAYQKENQKDKQIYLVYARTQGGTPGFYLYDSLEKTLQRYIEASASVESATDLVTSKQFNDTVQTLSIVIGIMAAIIIFLTLRIVRAFMKRKGYTKEFE